MLTSGKVPLEKTLMKKAEVSKRYAGRRGMLWWQWRRRHLHEKTGLSAGTVANDDELASDFSHGCTDVHVSRTGLAWMGGKEV